MSDEETFYDSLEEDNNECQTSTLKSSSVKDFSSSVPLYVGEISKTKISVSKKKREKKSKPVIDNLNKTEKTYLTMYYEKMRRIEAIKTVEGSDTTRAVCGKLSPRRDLQLEDDLKSVDEQCHSDSEEEEFYKNIISLEIKKKEKNETNLSPKVVSSRSSTTFKSASENNFKPKQVNEKMEMWKKRQNYGSIMSMKNRIRVKELQSLKKIKISKLTQ